MKNKGNSSTAIATVYKAGKGWVSGITGLFKTMCDRLKIKADTILGLTKGTSSSGLIMEIVTKEYSWNFLFWNGSRSIHSLSFSKW